MAEVKEGIVVLLDVLGARNISIDDCKKFIENRDEFVASLQPTPETLTKRFIDDINGDGGELPEPEIITFADTILLTWEVPLSVVASPLAILETDLSKSFVKAISEFQMLLRGAISVGKYIIDQSTALGPAISDAAAWYERAEWSGIIVTPHAGNYLHIHQNDLEKFDEPACVKQSYAYYPVPLKDGAKLNLWCVSWPRYFSAAESREDALEKRSIFFSKD